MHAMLCAPPVGGSCCGAWSWSLEAVLAATWPPTPTGSAILPCPLLAGVYIKPKALYPTQLQATGAAAHLLAAPPVDCRGAAYTPSSAAQLAPARQRARRHQGIMALRPCRRLSRGPRWGAPP